MFNIIYNYTNTYFKFDSYICDCLFHLTKEISQEKLLILKKEKVAKICLWVCPKLRRKR